MALPRGRKGTTGNRRVPSARRASSKPGWSGRAASPRARALTARSRWWSARWTLARLSNSSGSSGQGRSAASQRDTPRVTFFSTSTRVTPYQDMARGSRGARRWARSKAAWAADRSPGREGRQPLARAPRRPPPLPPPLPALSGVRFTGSARG